MWPILLNKKIYTNNKLDSYDVTVFMYDRMSYRCNTTRQQITPQSLANAVPKNMVFPFNFTMRSDGVVIQHKYNNGEDIIRKIADRARTFLERQYGSGTDLAGHCIEACCYLESTLRYMGLSDMKQIEGWCLWENEDYGSSRPYDEHTWIEISNGRFYLDITADQFNVGFFDKKHFKPIEFRLGVPSEMRHAEPIDGVDYWIDC